jgi:glycerophosphoryl diester phosphodiesterase
MSSSRPLVIAHRGNSSAAPENTLAAFRSALALKVDGVEFDYHHTSDGVPVVIHDATLDRTTNAFALWHQQKVAVATRTLAELRHLDAGAWFGANREFAGEQLATVEEALELICGDGAIGVIERKSGDAATLVNLLRRKRLLDRVVVMAFDWQFLTDCWQLERSLKLVALGNKELTPQRIEEAVKAHATVVGWDQNTLSDEGIAQIHARGLQAWTWTTDDADRMRALCKADIDAITTNYPARLVQVLSTIQSN